MKKFYYFLIALCLPVISLTGCKSEENTEYTFSQEEAGQIYIHTDGQNIQLIPTDAKDIKLSMTSKDSWEADSKDGILTVDIKSSSSIINIKTQTLYISLPSKTYEKIELITASGKITAEKIQAAVFSAKTDSGNISIKNIAGDINAKTNSGKIKSSLSISSNIVPEDGGYSLKGSIESDKNQEEASEISLNSISGTITID